VSTPDDAHDAVEDRREQAKAAKVQTQIDGDKRKIVAAMAKFSNGETAKVIRGRAGISGERFNVIIASLLEDGAVVETQLTKPNRKAAYDGYKLAE